MKSKSPVKLHLTSQFPITDYQFCWFSKSNLFRSLFWTKLKLENIRSIEAFMRLTLEPSTFRKKALNRITGPPTKLALYM